MKNVVRQQKWMLSYPKFIKNAEFQATSSLRITIFYCAYIRIQI